MKLFLNGGGVGENTIDVLARLNDIIDHDKKVLYVPLAWVKDQTYESCLDFIRIELSDLDIAGIEMVKSGDELVNKDFSEYAFIYIGGGNTYKLLNELKISGSFDKLKDYLLNCDGIVYGGSAGAIIFGKDLDSCNTDDLNNVNLEDNSAFNMLNGYSLLCHYTNRSLDRTELSKKYLLQLSKEKPIYALPEEDTIIVNDDEIEIIGTRPYYEFIDGKEIEHKI